VSDAQSGVSPAPVDSGTMTTPDMKPRSRAVTDGIEATTSRGMLRAVGMGDDDWDKPQVGIASSWNEITPCNLSLGRLAQAAKEGVFQGGGYPLQFGTVSVSDGISMGHEGMHFSLSLGKSSLTRWKRSCRQSASMVRCYSPGVTSRFLGC